MGDEMAEGRCYHDATHLPPEDLRIAFPDDVEVITRHRNGSLRQLFQSLSHALPSQVADDALHVDVQRNWSRPTHRDGRIREEIVKSQACLPHERAPSGRIFLVGATPLSVLCYTS